MSKTNEKTAVQEEVTTKLRKANSKSRLTHQEENVIRMIHGITADDHAPLERKQFQNEEDVLKVLLIEAEALKEIRGTEKAGDSSNQKTEIISRLNRKL